MARALRESAVRTEEVIREPVKAPRVRVRKGGMMQDQLFIPQEMIPEGVDLQWVTDSVLGKPDPQTRMSYEINGWQPVTGQMWDGLFDGRFLKKGYEGEINVGGLVLMERPMELTMEARGEEKKAADFAVRAHEAKLKGGHIDNVTLDTSHPTARAKTFVRREVVAGMPVPKD